MRALTVRAVATLIDRADPGTVILRFDLTGDRALRLALPRERLFDLASKLLDDNPRIDRLLVEDASR